MLIFVLYKGLRWESGQIRLHTDTHAKTRQQMGPCSICIRLSPSLFYLIKTDSLQLAQSFHLLCAWKESPPHTQSCFDKLRQKQSTCIVLSVNSTHSTKWVSTCTLDYCLSPLTFCLSLPLSVTLSNQGSPLSLALCQGCVSLYSVILVVYMKEIIPCSSPWLIFWTAHAGSWAARAAL